MGEVLRALEAATARSTSCGFECETPSPAPSTP
jgi:hypothetical protein